ncbi:hypothetical protein HY410_01300 [Candidatus Gottesmanbacteria bacterium]|nr:hypothetical protein [Candidatus Gottesmanbacteria bacterium]
MATLTETAYYTRRSINWLILAVIGYIILRFSWTIFVAAWLAIFPPKPPPPNNAFGVLPKLQFPQQSSPSGQLSFRLETIQGRVPAASESAIVYFMPKSPANLLALNETQKFAERLSLNPNPIQETKNIYRFADPNFILRSLRYDIVSNNFILRYRFEEDTGVLNEKNFAGSDALLNEARSLLQSYGLYTNDIQLGKSSVTFFKLVGDKLVPTTSLSTADAVRVDFFRKTIGNTAVVIPNPDEGPINFIFSGSTNTKQRILQFAYTYWPIDYDTTARYGLKNSTVAWQELQGGAGYIARYPKTGQAAVVRNVYLAYYDSYDPQTYLQPVFVFEGDNDFMAYVPAVAPPWVEN